MLANVGGEQAGVLAPENLWIFMCRDERTRRASSFACTMPMLLPNIRFFFVFFFPRLYCEILRALKIDGIFMVNTWIKLLDWYASEKRRARNGKLPLFFLWQATRCRRSQPILKVFSTQFLFIYFPGASVIVASMSPRAYNTQSICLRTNQSIYSIWFKILCFHGSLVQLSNQSQSKISFSVSLC